MILLYIYFSKKDLYDSWFLKKIYTIVGFLIDIKKLLPKKIIAFNIIQIINFCISSKNEV